MTEIVLFHSVLGLRDGVFEAAERLRAAGHTVHVPDLYRGEAQFDDYEPAMAYVDTMGFPELIARTMAAVEGLPNELVYAGFSNGGVPAQLLAGTRPGARGAVLFHAALSPAVLDVARWPDRVPVQVHYMEGDPWREQDGIDALETAVRHIGGTFELCEYPGKGHLFTDSSLPDEYDGESTELLWSRVLRFLGS
ncbi:MAG: dienelactone hydrolase [Pseudonocardiales bacterium]|nr:MAG: dienelactone hydrolase [Pseudonocardiales bacterium]